MTDIEAELIVSIMKRIDNRDITIIGERTYASYSAIKMEDSKYLYYYYLHFLCIFPRNLKGYLARVFHAPLLEIDILPSQTAIDYFNRVQVKSKLPSRKELIASRIIENTCPSKVSSTSLSKSENKDG